MFYDITATVEGPRSVYGYSDRGWRETIFIPLTVGGGIQTLADFDRVLKCGADKVSVNSGAHRGTRTSSAQAREALRQPVRGPFCGRKAGGRVLPRLCQRRPRGHRAWTPSTGSAGASTWAPVRSCSTPSTPTASSRALTLLMLDAVCQAVNVPVIASGGAG